MKKPIFILILSFLIISLIFNGYQHKVITAYKEKQHFNDIEFVAMIGQLNYYLDKINFDELNEENIRACLSMSERISTLVRNSNYNNNENVVECFIDVDNVFTGWEIDKIRKIGPEIKVLLKSTTNGNRNEINPDECKKLSKLIRDNM